jgi:putative protein-disulfide isomerase
MAIREHAEILYLFDPLCGWCYAAAPAIQQLRQADMVGIRPLPVGLFARENSRPMTPTMRDYAWANDQRIAALTGQTFSDTYYREVLDQPARRFDSWPATLALTAVERALPGRALDYLQRLQRARFVGGHDLNDPAVLADVAAELDFPVGQFHAAMAASETEAAALSWIDDGKRVMARLSLGGVPAVVLRTAGRDDVIPLLPAYKNPAALPEFIAARLHAAA